MTPLFKSVADIALLTASIVFGTIGGASSETRNHRGSSASTAAAAPGGVAGAKATRPPPSASCGRRNCPNYAPR